MGVHEDDGSASGAPPPPPPPQPAATSARPATSSPNAASKLFFEVKPFLLTSDDRLAPGRTGAPQVSVVSLCCATGIRGVNRRSRREGRSGVAVAGPGSSVAAWSATPS